MKKNKEKQSVVKSALKMSLGTFSSRVLGLVRDALLGGLFSRTVTDAFVVAFRLPNFFRRLLGEGSLNVSFVPVFVEQLNHGEEEEANHQRAMKLANSIYTLLLGVAGCLSVLGILFMEPLMEFLVGTENFAGIPGKLELTTLFARLMFAYLFFVTSYAYLMAIANSVRAFFIPAVAPAFFNLCIIVAALLPELSYQYPGLWLAWGVIFGGILQFIMVAVQLYKLGYMPKLTLRIRAPGLATVLKNMVPGLIGLGILQVISLINIKFAGMLPEGTHTYLYYGDRLLELPQSLLAISLGTALLPSLSELLALGKKEQMLEVSARYMRLLMFLALPSCVGLYVLAEPIVQVLFGRGEFDMHDIQSTAMVLRVYSFLLLASSFTKVIVPSFYAMKDTRTPAFISLVVVAVHLVLAPTLMFFLGLKGLVLSTTVSGFVNTGLLIICYRYWVGRFYFRKLVGSIARMIPSLFAMGIIAFYLNEIFQKLVLASSLQGMVSALAQGAGLLTIVALSVTVYFVIAKWTRVGEAHLFFEAFQRRIKAKKARATSPN